MAKEKLTDEISIEKSQENELDVSRVVLKTGLFTALVFLLVLIFAFTITAFVSPKFVADMSFKIGAKNLSERFSIAQYERTNDINDLATAVERSISNKNYKNIAKYAKKLVEFKSKSGKEEFEGLAKFKDKSFSDYYKDKEKDVASDYYNFIYGNYVYSLYKINEKDTAYETAFSALKKTDDNVIKYVDYNPLSRFIDAYIEDSKRPANDKLLQKLEEMYEELKLFEEDEDIINNPNRTFGINICFDLMRLYKTLNDDNAEKWKSKFELLYPDIKSADLPCLK